MCHFACNHQLQYGQQAERSGIEINLVDRTVAEILERSEWKRLLNWIKDSGAVGVKMLQPIDIGRVGKLAFIIEEQEVDRIVRVG